MFFYCSIYVSPAGHNQYGRGTPMLPFRDVSRAIEATLSQPRAYGTKKGFDYPRKRGVYDETPPATEPAGGPPAPPAPPRGGPPEPLVSAKRLIKSPV